MKKNICAYIAFSFITFLFSCKDKYERPDVYAVDLFENDQKNQPKFDKLDPDVAFRKSELVIVSNDVELQEKPVKVQDKNIYFYILNSGRFQKTSNDSIEFPMMIISDYNLNPNNIKDSSVIYLQKVSSYKLLLKNTDIKYQTLPLAPINIKVDSLK